ncbi:glycoside hydrolase family 31 protein [Cylindrobasidium torrendii FP15055 ss-10]|uniref:alpha-D-xyloside xylohydrolase n=1 Tax=Cylindrobasidium torrendii FP15055 ss-10 TaxID=1314674 RepID=A0A0D7BLQ4_9AGAR|nr:glycoside hydrolase family 31 protein [Cylindrobasidium torrendii FP15055 ss-10]
MVKFSTGMWENAPGVVISWATEMVKSEALEDRIRAVATTRKIYHRGDVLNTATITFECSSPMEDVLLLDAYHWKSQKPTLNGPHYEVFPDVDIKALASSRQDGLRTTKTNEQLSLSTNTLSATFDTRPGTFNLDIQSHNVPSPTGITSPSNYLLTKLGWRSVGYVKKDTNLQHPNLNLVDPDKGEMWMTYQFQLSVGEKIYGLGERFGAFAKNGQGIEMWNEDGGTSSELTYKNVPFFLSSRGYGIFVANPGAVSFEVQSERTTRVNISVPFEELSVYIIHGPTPAQILQRYTTITGRPALPPPWTFNLWLTTSFTTSYDEGTVNKFLDGMAERDITLGVFHFDCFWMKGFQWCDFEFDSEYFPDPKGQLARMHEKGLKVCVWINPYIAQESKIFDEGVEGGFFLKKRDGSVWQFDHWQAGMAFVDFTNPDACSWYQSKLKALMDLGVDCFKTDFGERIPTGNVVYFDGSNPEKMHNYYAFLYNKVTFEVVEKHLGKHEAVLFARSATAGCQRFPVHWGGDPMSTFEAMAETLRGGMSLGLSGFGYWAHDIGGFEGTPDVELYKRWFAFGALSSHTRLHGSGSYRVPWVIDATGEADRVLKKFIDLKLSLMPYLYATAIGTHKTGVPMMRPLFVEFPEDPICWTIDTQFMMGSDLLVCPVFNAEGTVQFYVPEGEWYGLIDGKIRTGPRYYTETHDAMGLPILVRPGAVIALGQYEAPSQKNAAYDYAFEPTFLVNPSAGGIVDEALVPLPDFKRVGEMAAVLRIYGTADSVQSEVVEGRIRGKKYALRVIGASGGVAESLCAL